MAKLSYFEGRESPLAIGISAAIAIIVFGIIGSLGSLYVGFGWGGALAGLAIGGLFVVLYAFEPGYQSYTKAILLFVIGAIVGSVIESYVPFAAMQLGALNSGTFAGQIAGGLTILLEFVGMIFGFWYVKADDIA